MGTRTNYNNNFSRVSGGGTRDRTADLLHAMQALSQLSYTPIRETAELLRVWRPRIKNYAFTPIEKPENSDSSILWRSGRDSNPRPPA